MIEDCEKIARACYEVNRAYCEHAVGDLGRPPWEQSSLAERDRYVDGVKMVMRMPRTGYAEIHQNWVDNMARDGWTLGNVKDDKKKEHPNLVHFVDLPPVAQAKIILFRTTVLSMGCSPSD